MVWIAKLREAKRSAGKWDVSIIYTDGTQTLVKGYTFDAIGDAVVKQAARQEIARLNAADLASTTLISGSEIDTTETPTPLPIVDVAREAFFDKLDRLRKLLRLVEYGLLPSTDPRIATLQNALKASWQNAYMDGI